MSAAAAAAPPPKKPLSTVRTDRYKETQPRACTEGRVLSTWLRLTRLAIGRLAGTSGEHR